MANSSTGARGQARGLVDRAAEGDERGHGHGGGRAEQGLDVGLVSHDHRGHDARQSFGVPRQQQAPAKRVQRRAADEGVAVEASVDARQPAQVPEHHA